MFQTKMSLPEQIKELLAEEISLAKQRRSSTFDELAGHKPIILFGAGGLGKKTLSVLRKHGIEPLSFCDNNSSLWDQEIDGLIVLNPITAANVFGKIATFIVTIWRAGRTHRFTHTRDQLKSLGCETVVPFMPLFWKYAEDLLPYYLVDTPENLLQHANEIGEAFALYDDKISQEEFYSQLKWRLHADFECLGRPVQGEQYFQADLFSIKADDFFIDCGAYIGDTIETLLRYHRNFKGKIWAFEPDPSNFNALQQYISNRLGLLNADIKFRLLPYATGEYNELIRFGAMGNASSGVNQYGEVVVESHRLSDLLKGYRPTFIKMDIEGAEYATLLGARETIQACKPILAVCVYHKPTDFWRIPKLIKSFSKDYRIFLRLHNEEGWDTVCYAIPPERLEA